MKKLIFPILTLLMTASCGNTKSVNTNTEDDLNKTTDRLYKELHKLLSETN